MNVQQIVPVVALMVVTSISGCLGGGSDLLDRGDSNSKAELTTEGFSENTWAAQWIGCLDVVNLCAARTSPPPVSFQYRNQTMVELEGTVEWGHGDDPLSDDPLSIAGRKAHIRCLGEPENCGGLTEPVVVEKSTSPMEIRLDLNVSAGTKIEILFIAEQVGVGPFWTSYEFHDWVAFSGTVTLKKEPMGE